jgi:predicted enzyme related to lactoylglutathione lyase
MINKHHTINYLELPLEDHAGTKLFYESVFGWKFQDWGPDYLCFEDAGIGLGFNRQLSASPIGNGALVVLYSEGLEATLTAVTQAGGSVVKEVFEFPGGRRFHFTDPNGNEIAVWSQ